MRCEKTMQRRPHRHTVKINCQVVRERDFRLVADRVENLSAFGMLVSPAEPVMTGERVFVSFRLPDSNHWIDAEATVTRVVHGRRPAEHQRMLGLEFESLSPYDRFRLRRALYQRPLAPPSPRSGRRRTLFDLRSLVFE